MRQEHKKQVPRRSPLVLLQFARLSLRHPSFAYKHSFQTPTPSQLILPTYSALDGLPFVSSLASERHLSLVPLRCLSTAGQ